MARKKLNLDAFRPCNLSEIKQKQLKGGRSYDETPVGVGGGSFIGSSIDIRNEYLNSSNTYTSIVNTHTIM